MLFNSLSFLLFFPVVTALYFALPHRFRWAHLLLFSCAFYMSFVPVYIFILLGTIAVDYVAGILIENATGFARRAFLAASIVANVGVLAFFKYFNFFNDTATNVGAAFGHRFVGLPLTILLPIGLSFHTFQALSYTIEVYRGNQKAERHLGIYALYVMFYPQLVAGPIERPQNLLHQFREHHPFQWERVRAGLFRMLWGLFKKMVIADRCAAFVDTIFGSPVDYPRLSLIAATYLFAVQIYCDFSGYTDVALGAAQVMGFTLMENFDHPYSAASVSEFWRRWHISLSTWFKDYLYFPLGGSRVRPFRWGLNILVVFLLSGLWHGATWAFVLWGVLHGMYIILERATAKARDRFANFTGLDRLPQLRRAINVILTFNVVCLTWIFFRAGSLTQTWTILRFLFGPVSAVSRKFPPMRSLGITVGLIAVFAIIQTYLRGKSIVEQIFFMPTWVRWTASIAIIVTILWVGVLGQRSFIYFQF